MLRWVMGLKTANAKRALLAPPKNSDNDDEAARLLRWLAAATVEEPKTVAWFAKMVATLEQLGLREDDPDNLEPDNEEQLRKDLNFSRAQTQFNRLFGGFRFRARVNLDGKFRLVAESSESGVSSVNLAFTDSEEGEPGEFFGAEEAVATLISRFAAGMPTQFVRCRRPGCTRWLLAWRKNYKWCSEDCRLQVERSKPDVRKKAQKRMSEYRKSKKEQEHNWLKSTLRGKSAPKRKR